MLFVAIASGERTAPNRAHMAYDHGGLKALRRKPSGGRKRENMTMAEEKALLRHFAFDLSQSGERPER